MSNGVPPAISHPESNSTSGLTLPLVCCWLLMLVTFSAPGRESPHETGGLDVIALAKLAVRGLIVLLLARDLAQRWDDPRRTAVMWCLTPFALFLGWSLLSAIWSPMKTVSLGQWGSLLCQVLVTASIAVRWRGPADTSVLLFHIGSALTAVSVFLSAVDMVSHDLSGLNREDFLSDASSGLVHPTSAGATGSLGVVLLTAVRVLWGWPWSRALLVPGLAACGALLLLSHSRMAAAMTGVILGLTLVRYTGTRTLAATIVAASIGLTIYLVSDPGLTAVDDGKRAITEYFRRGETDEQMSSLNGRGDLWEAVWMEFERSPVIGHGYFMTSRTGILDVWAGPAMRTAHNFVLQVLVSTGVVGTLLFLWALVRPAVAAAYNLRGTGEAARVRAFLLLMGAWYLGWGQLCESFTGPVQPESVVFYACYGLLVAHVRSVAQRLPEVSEAAEQGMDPLDGSMR